MENAQESDQRFLSWLREHGALVDDRNHCKIGLKYFEDTGRGTASLCDIQASSTVVEIPIDVIFCERNIFRCHAEACILEIVRETQSIISQQGSSSSLKHFSKFIGLALMLMFERANPISFWSPYLKVIPQAYDMPIYWSETELEYLRGTLVEKLVVFSKSNLVTLYNDVVHPFCALYGAKTGNDIRLEMEDLQWALSSIWSRGYWLDAEENQPCLVPLADMLNHSHQNRHDGGVASYGFDEARQVFRITSRVDYVEGAQVYTYYGDKTNYEFLNDYGFLLANATPKRSDLLLQLPIWKLDTENPSTEKKIQLFERVGLQNRVVYLGGEIGFMMVVAARIFAMTDADVSFWVSEVDVSQRLLQNVMISRENEIGAIAFMVNLCSELLEGYPTSISTDAFLLASNPDFSYRISMAIRYRMEEKRLIWSISEFFQQYLDNLLAGKQPAADLACEHPAALMLRPRKTDEFVTNLISRLNPT